MMTAPAASTPRPRWRRLRRAKWLGLGLVTLVMVGAVYQAIAAARDQRAYPLPGQLVPIDTGLRLHLLVTGESRGTPTVILEAGMASFSSNWHWVQQDLARSTRVVSYDRAGLGWSDPPPEPRDAHQSARDLHAALEGASLAGPYVVAGHSYGGLVVRAFRDLYPDEVVGMTLVDASHPDQWTRLPGTNGGRTVALANRVSGWLAGIGLVRVLDLAESVGDGLPERQAGELTAAFNRPRAWFTSSRVLSLWDGRTRTQINGARPLGNLPLAVLGVTDQPRAGEQLTALQAELPALSGNSFRRIVEGATHESLVAKQEYALVVAEAIRRVMALAATADIEDPTGRAGLLHR